MATAFISTSAELVLLNTTTRAGVVLLPSTNTIPGRILTFKDTRGTFGTNPITFSTSAANQTLENNAIRLTYNDPFGVYSFIAGYDNKWYTIGGSRMYAASISSITTINLTSQQISSGNISVSTLQFRDTATTSTNTLFSLSTNVYYSSPVSFFSLGPTKAPKPLFTPIRRPFAPNQISGLVLWLDASDPNTLVSIGNNLRIWMDKSSQRNNARYSLGTVLINQGTINNLPAVQFQAASGFVNTITYTNNYRAVFVVSRLGVQGGVTFNYIYLGGTPAGVAPQMYSYNGDLEFNRNGLLLYVTQTPTPFFNTISIASATNSTQTGAPGLYINGTAQTLTVNTTATMLTGTASHTIGGEASQAQSYFMAEMIIIDANITQLQRQQVEGYLAWKWGLAGNLPSTHPFKNSPP